MEGEMSEGMEKITHAVGDKVLIRQIKPPEVTDAGIVIPPSAQGGKDNAKYALHGEVLAVGPDVPADVEVGDHVIFDRYTRTVNWRGDELRVVPADEVLLILGKSQ
jgi:co-chaperonin GroES (HSP10)